MMYTLFNISCTSFVQFHKSNEIAQVPFKPKIIWRYLPIECFIDQLEDNSSDINKVTIQVHMCTRPFYGLSIKTMFGSSYPQLFVGVSMFYCPIHRHLTDGP